MIYGMTEEEQEKEDQEVVETLRKVEIKCPDPNREPIDLSKLATNVLELSPEEVQVLKDHIDDLTLDYQEFLSHEIIPHLLAVDRAVENTRVLMADGLNRKDIVNDSSLLLTLKWLLHFKTIEFIRTKLDLNLNDRVYENLADLMKQELGFKPSLYSAPQTVGIVRTRDREKKPKKPQSTT